MTTSPPPSFILLRTLCLLAILLATTLPIASQTSPDTKTLDDITPFVQSGHITTQALSIGIGPTKLLDTYLSQEHFSGTGASLASSSQKRKPGKHWSTLMEHQANFAICHDRSHDNKEIQGDYSFFWGKLRAWNLLDGQLRLEAGGMATGNIGFIYNTSNGNNPAQAKLSLQIMPTATAYWKFQLLHRQMALRYELQLPLAGLMFSPNYGQSYYEIFSQGNYDHNCVPTTFISAPNFRQQLSLDINVSRKYSLRIGYLGFFQQSDVNNLKSHIYSNRFMIGIVRELTIINYRP